MSHCHTFIQTLRERGYRITPQREMVIEALAHSGRHLTAEEILEAVRVRTRALNLATVYRTLELLVGEGLTSRIDLGYGRTVYATIHHGPHIHLVCRQCGHVIEADDCVLEPVCEQIREQYGFDCDTRHISITGLCTGCVAESPRVAGGCGEETPAAENGAS